MLFYYAFVIEYFGGRYCGFQKQINYNSIQKQLEVAISKVANHNVTIVCAGRTDKGVHATSQVISFSTQTLRDDRTWCLGVNSLLPSDIIVRSVFQLQNIFSARFDACYRRYNYLIDQSRFSSALWDNHSFWINNSLDLDLMNEACKDLLGEKDFSTFRASKCQAKSTHRYIHHAYFTKRKDFVIFDIKANAFLYKMVRNILGALVEIGLHRQDKNWINWLIKHKNRAKAGKSVPAKGLYLVEVGYPTNSIIASKLLLDFW